MRRKPRFGNLKGSAGPLIVLKARDLNMDIASPFVVVPVIVVTFFCCILFATRGNPDSHQPTEDSAGHVRPHGS